MSNKSTDNEIMLLDLLESMFDELSEINTSLKELVNLKKQEVLGTDIVTEITKGNEPGFKRTFVEQYHDPSVNQSGEDDFRPSLVKIKKKEEVER
jgi:hypothetical protein